MNSHSIIIPAKNEEAGLDMILPRLKQLFPDTDILVINDCSTDNTLKITQTHGARVISHPYSMGNGAAIKTGARAAKGQILIFMDADGQHDPNDIPRLLQKLNDGYDMVIGARDSESPSSVGRWYANKFYSRLASWMVGQPILDLTSGFRAVRAEKFREFLHLLPNGFSYPTTITMSFFRSGYTVSYLPIRAELRHGKSHIRLFKDGLRFLIIIFRIGTLYSPLKIFLPFSLVFFLTGLGYYVYTFTTTGRFTNMSGLLFTTSVLVFLIGLVSEQITNLLYSRGNQN
jgi:glycosyltransferase involved in cell wall biosynthesis